MRNGLHFGTLATAMIGGFALVDFPTERRRVYFAPARFTAPWPVPGVADRVAVEIRGSGGEAHALWVLGAGVPSYTYSGGA